MADKATLDLLNKLHGIVAQDFITRIEKGEATAADLSTAIKFLKNNGIEADLTKNPNLGNLADKFELPSEAEMGIPN